MVPSTTVVSKQVGGARGFQSLVVNSNRGEHSKFLDQGGSKHPKGWGNNFMSGGEFPLWEVDLVRLGHPFGLPPAGWLTRPLFLVRKAGVFGGFRERKQERRGRLHHQPVHKGFHPPVGCGLWPKVGLPKKLRLVLCWDMEGAT